MNNVERLEKAGLRVSNELSKKVLDRINGLDPKDVENLIYISHKITAAEAAAAEPPGDALVGIQQAHF
jgi:hypothetical protein